MGAILVRDVAACLTGPRADPVIDAYKAGVDRTLIRERLARTPAERVEDLVAMARFAEERCAWLAPTLGACDDRLRRSAGHAGRRRRRVHPGRRGRGHRSRLGPADPRCRRRLAHPVRVFDRDVLCLDLPTLIRVKRAAGRPRDLEALAELK